MEAVNNNFIFITTKTNVNSNMGDTPVHIELRNNKDGAPDDVQKTMDAQGNVNKIAENFIRTGFDPSKVMINNEPATDVFQLNDKKLKEIKRAPFRIGKFGFQSIGKYSDEEVAQMNKTRLLPDGNYLVFRPQINEYVNGIFTGFQPANAFVHKYKQKNLEFLNKAGFKYTNQVPSQYKFVNDKGKTYIVEQNTDIKQAKKDFKRYLTGIGLFLAGLIAAGISILKIAGRK